MCSQTFLSAKTDILDFRIKVSPFVSSDKYRSPPPLNQYVNKKMRNENSPSLVTLNAETPEHEMLSKSLQKILHFINLVYPR